MYTTFSSGHSHKHISIQWVIFMGANFLEMLGYVFKINFFVVLNFMPPAATWWWSNTCPMNTRSWQIHKFLWVENFMSIGLITKITKISAPLNRQVLEYPQLSKTTYSFWSKCNCPKILTSHPFEAYRQQTFSLLISINSHSSIRKRAALRS